MSGSDLLDKLLVSFRDSYDVERSCEINGITYDAYASFNVSSARYVLVKKAQLWRADCFEHVFFRLCPKELLEEKIEEYKQQIEEYIEPELVRGGEKWPKENHMYTYMTAVYICEKGVSAEAERALRSFRYMRNYKLTIRGYSEARILVFDLEKHRIFGNRAGRELVKGYKKAGII